jgi:hypothetical protein
MPSPKKVIATASCAVVLLAVAVFLILDYNRSRAGYVAVYTVVAMWMLCGFAIVSGVAFVFFRKTRTLGILTLASGALLPIVFFVGVGISESEGWIRWANQPMRTFGPAVQAAEVVYYNLGVTDSQMESFERSALYQPRADGAGFDFKSGITYFLRLSPSQAHGRDAFAIGIEPALRKRRDQLRSLLTQSPVVFRVYDDIAPKDIPAP